MNSQKSFKRFMVINCGQVISLIGSGLTDFALFYYILSTTIKSNGNISQYTILYFFMYGPGIFVAPFIGTLVDRINKKYIIIASDTVAALGSLIILLLNVNGSLNNYYIYIVIMIKSIASAFQGPTFQAGISELVEPKEYGKAIGMAQIGESINKIVSPIVGGILYYSTSLEVIIVIDIVCYFIATILISLCDFGKEQIDSKKDDISFLKECKLGFKILIKDKLIMSLLILFIFDNFFVSFIEIIVQPLVYIMNEHGGMGISNSLASGLVLTCGGIGMMISSVIIGIKGVPKNRIVAILIANAVSGMVLMSVILIDSVLIFAIGTLIYFLMIPVILGSNITIWQERIPTKHQGKVFSIRRACVLGISPISSLLAGGICDGINKQYNNSTLLQKLINSSEQIYAFLFLVIGIITVFISVIFACNRHFKFEMVRKNEEELG